MSDVNWLSELATVGAALAFGFGTYQYWRAQTWRRAEFVADQIRVMKDDPLVRNAMYMLDWDGREIQLFPEREGAAGWVPVTSGDLVAGLRIHGPNVTFSAAESRIRDTFDALFDHFERMQQFVEAGLVPAAAFEPYVRYWLRIIGDQRRLNNADDVPVIWLYLEAYEFRGVQTFMRSLGMPVDLPSAATTRVEHGPPRASVG